MRRGWRRWTWWINELGALALLSAALVALILAWDWNWFRPLIERQASSTLGRVVRIADFDVRGWREPNLVLSGIQIDNPEGFPRDAGFGRLQRLEVRVDPGALWHRQLSLTAIHLEQPQFALFAPPDAAPNWVFPTDDTAPDRPPMLQLVLGHLSIADGVLHFEHPQFKSDFHLRVDTQPGETPDAPELHLSAAGRYAGQPLSASFVGGALLALREPQNPYPVRLSVTNGATRLHLQGTLLDPVHLGGANLNLRFEGADLSQLYPLTGVPLPPTAPYTLQGRLDYVDGEPGPSVRFSRFTGRVGSSDLAGDVAVQMGGPRLRISGAMRSKKVLLADLGGFVGAAPGEPDVKGTTTTQKAEHAKQEASARLLPDKPINLPKLRGADFDIRYAAQRIESEKTPFDDLDAHLRIEDGVLSLRPLSFGIGGGGIAANLLLDGTQDLARVEADADFRQVDFGRVLREATDFRGAGRIDGRASLRARGNTVADLLGAGNGKLRLSMAGGDMSALLINLAGLDFGNALLSAMGIPSRAKLRCMIADLDLKDGTVNTDTLLLDTTEAKVIGTGTVNLRTEVVDYRIQTEPKTFNIGSVAAPINVRGPLKKPRIRPDAGSLARRGTAAVVLGIVGTPLAALAATVQFGTGKDADCAAMIKAVRSEAARLPHAPDLPPAPKPEEVQARPPAGAGVAQK